MNLNEETRQGYTISAKMKRVWEVEMQLAEQLFQVCEKYNLRCWLAGGTLLGAVRHKGFIPWDDDIDVIMLRPDYDKLCTVAQQEFKHPYFFQTTYSDKNYISGHAQLRNSNTAAICKGEEQPWFKHNRGIAIDVFVLDGVPSNKLKCFLHRTATMLLKKTIRASFFTPSQQKKAGKKVLSFFSRIIYAVLPYKKAFSWFDGLFRMVSGKKSGFVASLSFKYTLKRFVYPIESFNDTVIVDFEDRKFPIPSGWHEILVAGYGKDYMTPKQLPTMHGSQYFDTEHGYEEVAEALRNNKTLD